MADKLVKERTTPRHTPTEAGGHDPLARSQDADPLAILQVMTRPSIASPGSVQALQRLAGNRAVSRLLQAKLIVGGADDRYEQEADRVAEQVMTNQLPAAASASGPQVAQRQVDEEEIQTKSAEYPRPVQRQVDEEEIQTKSAEYPRPVQRQIDEEEIQTKRAEYPRPVQRQVDEEEIQTKSAEYPQPVQRQVDEEEIQTKSAEYPRPVQRQVDEEEIQTKAQGTGSFAASDRLAGRLAANRGAGSPLPGGVRSFMESRFGADFDGVRLHTGHEAVQMNQELSAQAFTHGRDIYLGQGAQAPGTDAGNRLLAHELTHVVQQTGPGVRRAALGAPGPVRRAAGPMLQRQVMTVDEWRTASALKGKVRSSALGRVDKALAEYHRFKSRENLDGIAQAIQVWLHAKQGNPSAREQAAAQLLNQITAEQLKLAPLPAPTVDLGNVPLTGTDIVEARQHMYFAAGDALNQLTAGETDEEILAAARELAGQFWAEANQPFQLDQNLLHRLGHEKQGAVKRYIKDVFSKELAPRLVDRIERTLQREPTGMGAVKAGAKKVGHKIPVVKKVVKAYHNKEITAALNVALTTRLNANGKWKRFAQELDIAGGSYSSKFTPVNATFDTTFAERGTGGYTSSTAQLRPGQKPLAERFQSTNLWYTEFVNNDAPEAQEQVLFGAFRSGAVAEKGLKGEKATMQTVAYEKAYDLLKTMVVQYLKSRDPDEQAAILRGQRVPTVPIVSTALLTDFWAPKFHMDRTILKMHADTLELFHNKRMPFLITWGNQNRTVDVIFSIINFNKAVNEMRLVGGSHGVQTEMNVRAMPRLEQLKIAGLNDLMAKLDNNTKKLSALPPDDPARQQLEARNIQLRIQVAKIEQLWARVQEMKGGSHSGSRYELPALVSNLAYQLGAMVHYNCMSGKDRTGMADVESKLLAYQMDARARAWVQSGFDQAKAELVPRYEADLREEDADAALKLIFEGGNLNIQKMNATVAGYKVRGALKGTIFQGRLEHILATERAQTQLRQYMGVDQTIEANAKSLSKMLQAFSIVSEA